MNCFEDYLVQLLQGHVHYHEKDVPVLRNFSNAPQLPVITLDLSAGSTQEYMYHEFKEVERVFQKCHHNINVNVWCNTEDERESIVEQVLQCFFDESNFHYRYCTRYSEGVCTTTGRTCPSIKEGRGGKFQCVDIETYKYQSLHRKCNIIEDTVTVLPPFVMDEYDKHPPLLRSVLRCDAYSEELIREFGKPY